MKNRNQPTKEQLDRILNGLMFLLNFVNKSPIKEYDLSEIETTPLGHHLKFNHQNYKELSVQLFGFEMAINKYIESDNVYHRLTPEQKKVNNLFLSNINRTKITKEAWLDEFKKAVDTLLQSLYYIREGVYFEMMDTIKIEFN